MFICSNANLMIVQNAGEVPRQLANDFLQKQNGYVMLEVQNGDETYHITKEMLKNGKSYRKDRGSMLVCTDQERFTTKENELLVQLHTEKKQGEGFRLGAEYLATLHLLSLCESLIASGSCNGITEAIRENAGKYQHVFAFELGTNERPE